MQSGEDHTGKFGRNDDSELLNMIRFIDFKAKEISKPSAVL